MDALSIGINCEKITVIVDLLGFSDLKIAASNNLQVSLKYAPTVPHLVMATILSLNHHCWMKKKEILVCIVAIMECM